MEQLVIYQWLTNYVCAPYRILFPAYALNQLPNFRVRTLEKLEQREFDEVRSNAELFIIQRLPMMQNLDRIIWELQRNGTVVVYELDDNLLELDPQPRFAAQVPTEFASQIKSCIQACDYVQCSTQMLADIVREIHPRVATLENQLQEAPPYRSKDTNSRRLVIAYAAGQDHTLDWAEVRDAYNRVLRDLEAAGIDVETWIIGDTEIFESIQSEHKNFLPTMVRDQYLKVLDGVDISIIPLRNTSFNRCKSDVKFLESASRSAAVVASRTVYGESILDGETGLLFDDGETFHSQLLRMAMDRTLARRIAKTAHDYVLEHRLMNQHVHRWADTYSAWCARRHQ